MFPRNDVDASAIPALRTIPSMLRTWLRSASPIGSSRIATTSPNWVVMSARLTPPVVAAILKAEKPDALLPTLGGQTALNVAVRLAEEGVLYRLGVRWIGLTWNHRNQAADGLGEQRTGGGLTEFGVQLVREMNRLGMLVDIAHLAPAGVRDVFEICQGPVIASHANERATEKGKLLAGTRTETFIKAVDAPVHLPLSGVTMSFDGNGRCLAGC